MDKSNAILFLCFDYSFVAFKMHTNFTFEDMVYSKHTERNSAFPSEYRQD